MCQTHSFTQFLNTEKLFCFGLSLSFSFQSLSLLLIFLMIPILLCASDNGENFHLMMGREKGGEVFVKGSERRRKKTTKIFNEGSLLLLCIVVVIIRHISRTTELYILHSNLLVLLYFYFFFFCLLKRERKLFNASIQKTKKNSSSFIFLEKQSRAEETGGIKIKCKIQAHGERIFILFLLSIAYLHSYRCTTRRERKKK